MYESFHGTPSTGELVIQDQIHYHGNLAELGVLCGLKVRVVTGEDFTLEFGGMPGQEGEPRRVNPQRLSVMLQRNILTQTSTMRSCMGSYSTRHGLRKQGKSLSRTYNGSI